MKASNLHAISETLLKCATPDMPPKQLLKAVRKEHPKATKKEIVHGAFYALITHADAEPDKAVRLQAFALSERTGAMDEPDLEVSPVS